MNNSCPAPEDFVLELSPGGSIKTAMKQAEASSRDLWQVPIANIKIIDGFNVRVKNDEYHAGIRELADAIMAEGFYQHKPLAGYLAKVDGEEFVMVFDGHRRFAASQLAISEGAEIKTLPVHVSKDGVSMEDLTVALVLTNTGKPLTPYEMGIVCKRMINFGHEIKAVATRLQMTPQYVSNLLALMAAPTTIQKMVADNQVSATTAIEVFSKHGHKAVQVLEGATEAAKSAGKGKVTSRFVPGAMYKKTLKKSSETMFQTLSEIKEGPGFEALPEEMRGKIIMLVETIAKTKDAPPAA